MTKSQNCQGVIENQSDFFSKLRAEMEGNGIHAFGANITLDDNFYRLPVDKGKRNSDASYIGRVCHYNTGKDVHYYCWYWNHTISGEPFFYSSCEEGDRNYKKLLKQAKLARAKAEAEIKKRAERAARIAQKIYGSTSPAPDNFPYFVNKKIDNISRIFHSGKFNDQTAAIIPVYSDFDHSQIQTLQFICASGEKRYLKGGAKDGGLLVIGDINPKDGELFILECEGVATAWVIHKATGLPVVVAFDAGNLKNIAQKIKAKFRDAVICICADNDIRRNEKGELLPNTGVETAERISKSVGTLVAIPQYDDQKVDFNDFVSKFNLGLEKVKEVIDKVLCKKFCYPAEDRGFIMNKERNGLFRMVKKGNSEDVIEIQIGPYIELLGKTHDENHQNWGTQVRFWNSLGEEHIMSIPNASLHNTVRSGIAETLSIHGYDIINGQIKHFVDFLQSILTNRYITMIQSIGWADNGAYVLPNETFGGEHPDTEVDKIKYKGLFCEKGSFQEWKELANLSIGNPNLVLALLVAFAGPLLKPANMNSFIIHFEGNSSTGKSTSLWISISVWGNPNSHLNTWRSTDNALEDIAAKFNHNLLALDEISEISSFDLKKVIYMLAGGQGKKRMKQSTEMRQTKTWRLLGLSTGEQTIQMKLGEQKIEVQAGQSIRFFDIEVNRDDIQEWHGCNDAGELVRKIKKLSETNYGFAGREWLTYLTSDSGMECLKGLPDGLDEIADALTPLAADGQVERAARCFALLAYAGFYAEKAGCLPQVAQSGSPTTLTDSYWFKTVKRIFDRWLDHRGGSGAMEEYTLLRKIKNFIEEYGQSRFQTIGRINTTTQNSNSIAEYKATDEQEKIFNLAGYKREKDKRMQYLFTTDAFERLFSCKAERAGEILLKHNYLIPSKDRNQQKVRIGNRTQNMYVLELPDDE